MDPSRCPNLDPNRIQFRNQGGIQNLIQIGSDFLIKFGSEFGSKSDPIWDPTWGQNIVIDRFRFWIQMGVQMSITNGPEFGVNL